VPVTRTSRLPGSAAGSAAFWGAAACVVAGWYRLQEARSTRRKTAAVLHTQHLMLRSRRLDVIRSGLVDVDLKQIICEIAARVWKVSLGGGRAEGMVGTSLSAGSVCGEGWVGKFKIFQGFERGCGFDGTKAILGCGRSWRGRG